MTKHPIFQIQHQIIQNNKMKLQFLKKSENKRRLKTANHINLVKMNFF